MKRNGGILHLKTNLTQIPTLIFQLNSQHQQHIKKTGCHIRFFCSLKPTTRTDRWVSPLFYSETSVSRGFAGHRIGTHRDGTQRLGVECFRHCSYGSSQKKDLFRTGLLTILIEVKSIIHQLVTSFDKVSHFLSLKQVL